MYISLFIVFQCFGIFVVLSEIPRPRGVSISQSSLYAPADTFTCLDGLLTIRYDQINDDFCDCGDGSDEPGTAACSNGIFTCTNAGHRPQKLPTSRVNDGICDCCDASDEYASNAQCTNNCSELGREEKQRQKQRSELAKQGNHLRADMSAKGKALKDEKGQRLLELQKSIEQAVALKNEREQIKKSAEATESSALDVYKEIEEAEKREKEEREVVDNRKEAQQTFTLFDSNADGVVEIAELQTRVSFDSNRDGEVSVEEAKYYLDEHDQVDFETFVTSCWPRIKPFLMLESGLFKPPATVTKQPHEDTDGEDSAADDELADLNDGEEPEDDLGEHYDEEETGEGEVIFSSKSIRVASANANIFKSAQVERVPIQSHPEYDEETQKIIEEANEARNQLSVVEQELRELESEQKQIQDLLEKDFGPSEEYAVLNGECFNYEDREYVYKLCPFDRAIQQPRNGGGETR